MFDGEVVIIHVKKHGHKNYMIILEAFQFENQTALVWLPFL